MGKGKKILASMILAVALCLSLSVGAIEATASTTEFVDVREESKYYYKPVYWAVEQGITAGTSATTFSPEAHCTRAQIVTFLWKAAGAPAVSTSGAFTDVASNAWYARAVSWAVAKGITKGISANRFGPSVNCTRAQAVTFIWKAANSPSASSYSSFSDVPSSTWYKGAVDWAVQKGITSGVSASKFAPGKGCTRAQIVTFLWKYYGSVTPKMPEKVKTSEDLFAKFLQNKVQANEKDSGTNVYYRDLQNRHSSFAYLGEKYADLDNDGEKEMILRWDCGPVHTYYLDAKDGKITIFVNNGSTVPSFYTKFRGAMWIGEEDTHHGNRQIYTLYRYQGADKIIEQTELSAWYQGQTYTADSDFEFGGKKISMKEFEKIKKEITDGMKEAGFLS